VLDHSEANWNGLLNAAVRKAKALSKAKGELKPLIIIPYTEGEKTDEDYRFLADVGISIQGQDANAAWKAGRHISRKLGLPLNVTFVWREKEGAAFPGITGRLAIAASK
jgi:hypothetical protein